MQGMVIPLIKMSKTYQILKSMMPLIFLQLPGFRIDGPICKTEVVILYLKNDNTQVILIVDHCSHKLVISEQKQISL